MKLSLSQAAKHYGISKGTLSKAIKSGKISATKEANGTFSIDPSEIDRVYGDRVKKRVEETGEQPHKVNAETAFEIKAMELELKAAQEKNRLLEDQLQDARKDRDEWRTQARSLIEDKSERPSALDRFFGKRNRNA